MKQKTAPQDNQPVTKADLEKALQSLRIDMVSKQDLDIAIRKVTVDISSVLAEALNLIAKRFDEQDQKWERRFAQVDQQFAVLGKHMERLEDRSRWPGTPGWLKGRL